MKRLERKRTAIERSGIGIAIVGRLSVTFASLLHRAQLRSGVLLWRTFPPRRTSTRCVALEVSLIDAIYIYIYIARHSNLNSSLDINTRRMLCRQGLMRQNNFALTRSCANCEELQVCRLGLKMLMRIKLTVARYELAAYANESMRKIARVRNA